MTDLPSPPQRIEQLPEKCIEAWQALGAELSESSLTGIRQTWNSKHWGVFVHYLREVRQGSPPVDRLPGWRDALMRLLKDNPKAYADHAAFLIDASIHLLSAADVLSIAGNVEILSRETLPQMWMRGFMPRNREERAGLAALIASTDNPTVQAAALDLLARVRSRRDESAAEKADRNGLLATAIAAISDEALHRFHDVDSGFGRLNANELVREIEPTDLLLTLAERGGLALRRAALDHLSARMNHDSAKRDRAAIERLSALLIADPVSFCKAYVMFPDVGLAEQAWALSDGDKMRAYVLRWAEHLFEYERFGAVTPEHPALPLLQRILDAAPDIASVWFWNRENYRPAVDIEFGLLQQLWRLQPAALLPLFLHWLGARLGDDPNWPVGWRDEKAGKARVAAVHSTFATFMSEVLRARSADIVAVKPTDAVHLLPFLQDPELLRLLNPGLMELAAKSKPIQRGLPARLAAAGTGLLSELGWLDDRRKGVRDVGLEALLLSTDTAAEPLLQKVHDDARTADADRDRIRARLGRKAAGATTTLASGDDTTTVDAQPGVSAPSAAAADLDALKARVAKAKIKPAVDKVWNEQLAAALAPLPPEYARWLLTLAVDTKDGALADTALGLLAHLSRERQAALAAQLVQLWLAENGDRKLSWLLLFVPTGGDDRLVEPLFEAFKSWHKRAKPKAVTALQTLGGLDTAYALSHVYEVYSKSIYSDAIHQGARAALLAAAKRRGCDLAGLLDEITPDFGLTNSGRVFDFGPCSYTMRVGTDLELNFTHSLSGKTSKTLPKAKDGEDLDARAAADAAIKLLRGGLKKVIKLQAQRLEDAMVSERRWPATRWRVLFVEHAVLGLIGQGLIWTRLAADGRALGSLRISEDRSLIDAADQPVPLADDDSVRLWHPALAEAGELDAWTAHLKDYEIKPFLDQVGRPVLVLSAEEMNATSLHRHAGLRVAQSTLKYGLEGWNYQIRDQDGSHIFGYMRRFTDGLRVQIDTEDMDASLYGDASVGAVEFYRGQQVQFLSQVPAPLLSLAAEHIGKLALKASK